LSERRRFRIFSAQQDGDGTFESLQRTRNYQAALCQKSSDLIDDGRTLAHENGTHSMHRLNVFLLDRFDANKTPCRDEASTIASASLRSFLFVFTNGVT
jgi:hypothetical protein